jgi:hypothetical protein
MSDQKKKSRGLGDTVKKAITVTTFGLVKQKPGCGCKGRQAWLNKKFPYKWYRDGLKTHAEYKETEAINAAAIFKQVTEEVMTPEQKEIRDRLFQQRTNRANKSIATPQIPARVPSTNPEVSTIGSNTIVEEKKCAPCEAARIERERLAALEQNQPDTTES